MKTNFHNKNIALGLALKMRQARTLKWPIKLKRRNSWKNKPRVFEQKIFYTFSHLVKAGVNAVMPL